MARRLLVSGIVLCVLSITLIGVLVVAYLRSNHIVFSEHEKFERGIMHLRGLDASLNLDVLRARSHLLQDYDGFPAQISEMRRTIADLGSVPSFVSKDGNYAIGNLLKSLSRVLDQKEEVLDRFKSQNALLNNSLKYLPLTGTALLRQISTEEASDALEAQLNALMRQVLVYSLYPSEVQATEIRQSIEKLNDWRADHPQDPRNTTLASLSAHARSIVTRNSQVEEVTRQLLAVPTKARIDDIFGLYAGQFSHALQKADLYRVVCYVLCTLLIVGIGYTLYTLDRANTHLEFRVTERTSDLSRKNEELEAEIAERLRVESEMEQMNKTLMDVSRRAGMAEVATSVLHNVGNVLNSVNVSCSVIAETVRKSRVGSVSKTAALLREHTDDLAGFFLHNPTGQKLPDFLGKLSHRLSDEQACVRAELQSLGRNIDHIREIVAMQQNYATVGGILETLSIKDLVEDALQMNSAALMRHGVEVIREYETAPMASVDKHKVLQILVNLICNAKHALTDGGRNDKRLMLRVFNDENCVTICVNDNGIGIAPDNLTRIFAHGFTTKKNGHGFGLHSGVLAAQEMGGRLAVQSKGIGTGATFTLELPLQSLRNAKA